MLGAGAGMLAVVSQKGAQLAQAESRFLVNADQEGRRDRQAALSHFADL